MIDLSGIARHLRLSVEQIRVVADLLEQGYQPGFIERYRADETGNLPRASLWLLKLEIDRQVRLQASRDRVASQLPKDAELDAEAIKYLQRATTEVELDAALRTFRSRRQLSQNQEIDKQASALLEKMIEYQGPAVPDLDAWAAEQLSVEPPVAQEALQHAGRLVGMLMHSDSSLNQELRRTIQRLAQVRVELCDPTHADAAEAQADADEKAEKAASKTVSAQQPDAPGHDSPAADTAPPAQVDAAAVNTAEENTTSVPVAAANPVPPAAPQATGEGQSESVVALSEQTAQPESGADDLATASDATQAPGAEPAPKDSAAADNVAAEQAATESTSDSASGPDAGNVPSPAGDATAAAPPETATADQGASPSLAASAEQAAAAPPTGAIDQSADQPVPAELVFKPSGEKRAEGKLGKSAGKKQPKANKPAKKPVAKMTPRQRRRRWLVAMLQPMKSLKSPLSKLSSYQHLMLGRGRRSQLVKTELTYDRNRLVGLARDTFVTENHPLAAWFAQTADEALEQSLRAKCEHDAVTDLEEIAADRLLVHSVDQLRHSLLQRPVRGHCILVVDATGPKAGAVAVVGPEGDVLAVEEIPCSASPGIVNQNVVRLGELVHQHRVSLVALTNGPARRFLVLSVRELMKQSAASGLRWTMADRSGADAYAVSRAALKELAVHNRRHRAAIWVARSLQDPLGELLKVDINRLRLGSYQRELPQEPLKQLVRETIADCVFLCGLDARKANADQLQRVTGVSAAQAQKIAAWSSQGPDGSYSRSTLLQSVNDWSEQDARQAIGSLRVYGSDQPLDATLIHPDDYRLAERLIEGTDLEMPPSAPPDWSPLSRVPSAANSPSTETSTDSSPASSVASSAGPTETTLPTPSTDSATADASGVVAQPASEVVAGEETTETESEISAEATVAEPEVEQATAEQATGEQATAEQPVVEPTAVETVPVEVAQATSDPAGDQPIGDAAPAGDAVTADDAAAPAAETTPVAPAPLSSWVDKSASASQQPGLRPEFPEDVTYEAPKLPESVDVEKLARGWQVGREKLRQVAHCLNAPFADPRMQQPSIPMMGEMPTLGNLQPDMCVWAVVIGVADFGAFVELAPECSGLIHISRLSPHFIEDPHQSVQVGDLVMAWVVSVDEKKNRVALTALTPEQRLAAAALDAQRRSERGNQRQRGPGGGRAGAPGEHARQGSSHAQAGSGRSDGRRGPPGGGGRSRGSQPGGPGGAGGRGRGRPTKPVVVTSKKPKANITAAMKEGEEPLRSFSDLMQFYDAKRTDDSK